MEEKRREKEDRRKEDKDRRKKDKEGKVRVWIKEETIAYEEELKKLQVELLKFQNHVKEAGLKVLIIFEGRDAAGKGGTIKRITEHLNPRGARIVALAKPSNQELTQWYFQRYVQHLPAAGEIVLFDRSWYNRAMVEPVMGFCTQRQHHKFLKDAPAFEKMIAEEDIKIFKFYFSVSKKEQAKRFQERENDPLKQYKLSPVDKESQRLWDEYTLAKFMMLSATHAEVAPWTIVKSDDKKKARLNAIKHILNFVDYPDKIKDSEIIVDKNIIVYGRDEAIAMEKQFKFSIK
ncbi:MAG: polyphosphate kinase 2 [Sulfurimonas sp. RIFOXYD12_FULL_33_39]|uniref:polyphosphate kinase 2 n=1 Tax=unclassified Sulfurimonas TaxID=2623549 RepID=UPI0008B3EFEE|nr:MULTISPECIES: polyphosphate kinase 2 [unclassified Sulfurimonas]OHE07292.1 MAG: polyphosphate kinase 2 [Sulfurimonas sp. RIFCSPLOWO2_12_FULL_34_6]OHE09756.1 MAG: polyphosphate kinase 2 [Sulfurimonas sp. RIFOXYD12_FULL_33_39]OHE13736.1 MAG: polyphosphate kinase 2 [Sulfurimonas sp. RIFOXYD2_FULL_34_21]DAB27931.1 MAG TPA: polyphosphate kinase 2 [Sulfurimonas sp. UBA10385]